MTDYYVLIISLGATLLASAIPQFVYWRNSKEADRKKRRWQLEDVLREKEIQIMEERINEINNLANALAMSFHEKRLAFIEFVSLSDEDKKERLPDYFSRVIENTGELQKEFYATTPMILSLGKNTEKFVQLWEELTEIDEELIHLIIDETARENWDELDRKVIIETLNEMKTDFNLTLAKFCDEIDAYRINKVDYQIRFATYD
jgi:hypothetical protein